MKVSIALRPDQICPPTLDPPLPWGPVLLWIPAPVMGDGPDLQGDFLRGCSTSLAVPAPADVPPGEPGPGAAHGFGAWWADGDPAIDGGLRVGRRPGVGRRPAHLDEALAHHGLDPGAPGDAQRPFHRPSRSQDPASLA